MTDKTKKYDLGVLLFGEPMSAMGFATYHDEYAYQVIHHASVAGTKAGVARAFNVSLSTIRRWLDKYPEFAAGFEEGKSQVDDVVVSALKKRALGYEVDEQKVNVCDGVPIITTVKKHIKPSVQAIEFYLKNRVADEWSDKQVLEHVVPLAEGLLAARKRITRPIESDE